ncbi:1-deoxy-D-xylulose-5-phosphate reductoisomerase [Glaciecola punicea ACAM 611]|jgi:1-deoxy-D-xylulose-5-phosphate reductoisomerase|uniref:1-deoxy-D-xylulose 5-phosphate reductoisomerase n=1 Tax=Glaciecola punicea ACAM 611 TaxID=1121923 RepID=H5TB70_9ALTE|nr:1-deoxy-D-xylulose-5-phosphate reductoisomerase [Glaciecola punicea]OFA32548.1 1-deoxy-D-xylulose-5-phosphate reductoisomerase [Glaciecola punicea]GAB55547.1 1-deoxy-D-xylulose-5-phosphate reductoisomerase [Glaciecola punicea ACAM 611]
MQYPQQICILGATGSIGTSTLDVISRHPDKFKVFALSGMNQLTKLAEQIRTFVPNYAVVKDAAAVKELKQILGASIGKTTLLHSKQGLIDIASASEVDCVMSAIVGAAGLLPTLAAVTSGKRILLANKEALVMSGELFINAVNKHKAQLIPIDSEHNAIFQCLPSDFIYGDKQASGISHLLLTGSGGPFRELPLAQFSHVTPAQACAHPNWSMGQKISIDSASMMNKGLEFIEAKWLFGFNEDDIEVVIHPQSTIHSMVQYVDGSVIAQMGNPDMRTPIAHGLAYPNRIESGVGPLNFAQLSNLSFSTPCKKRFPNLFLAIQASKSGQAATTTLNAANEVAVDAFLQGKVNFSQINTVNDMTLQKQNTSSLTCIDSIIEHDASSRILAHQIIKELV